MTLRALTLLALAILLLAGTAAAETSPSSDFRFSPRNPVVGQTVAFESLAVDDGSITNWTWDFGDGNVSYDEHPRHSYAAPGQYRVTLLVTDDVGLQGGPSYSLLEVAPAGAAPTTILPAFLYWLLPLLVGAALCTIAYLVLQRGQPAVYNLVFFLLYSASGLKSLTESFAILLAGRPGVLLSSITTLSAISAYLFVSLFVWFVLVFPRPIVPWLQRGKRGAITLLLAVPFTAAHVMGWSSFQQRADVFNAFSSMLALVCLGVLVYHAQQIDSREERNRIQLLCITFFLLVMSTFALSILDILQGAFTRAEAPNAATYQQLALLVGVVIVPLVEIVGCTVLMYAILHYQLLGVDHLVMKITRHGLVGVLVPSTFIIVSNVIEEIFQSVVLEGTGLRFDFIIAGFVSAGAMVPIQRFSNYVTTKWFPDAASTSPKRIAERRMEIYETQLRYHLLDGSLNDKEFQQLARLRASLKIPDDEVTTVARRFGNVDAQRLVATHAAA